MVTLLIFTHFLLYAIWIELTCAFGKIWKRCFIFWYDGYNEFRFWVNGILSLFSLKGYYDEKFVTWHTLDKLSMAKSAFLSHMNWKRRNTRFLVCYSSLTPRIWRAKIYLIFEKIIERGCKMCAWILHQFNTLERAKNPKISKKNRVMGASAAAVGRVKEQKHARSLE